MPMTATSNGRIWERSYLGLAIESDDATQDVFSDQVTFDVQGHFCTVRVAACPSDLHC